MDTRYPPVKGIEGTFGITYRGWGLMFRVLVPSLLLGLVACSGQPVAPPSPIIPPTRGTGSCGDGVLDALEQADPALCPQDATLEAVSSTGITPQAASPVAESGILPLYFFYAVHVHIAGSDVAPYIDDSLGQIDSAQAENMLSVIEGIADVLDEHGAKGSFQVTYGTSKGLCAYQGQEHIFKQLAERGHEIGIHVHNQEDILPAYENMTEACGLTPEVVSGFNVTISKVAPGLAQRVFSEDIRISSDLGLKVSTENLSAIDEYSLDAGLCSQGGGIGNDMALQTGNLLFPWLSDYQDENICSHDPAGDFALVDHVSITWLKAGGTEMPDVVGETQFDYLQQYLDGALAYMETNHPDQVAAWGFVTHIIEYAPGSHAENPPAPASLAALDTFLDYVDSRAIGGRIIYALPAEIASQAYPDR